MATYDSNGTVIPSPLPPPVITNNGGTTVASSFNQQTHTIVGGQLPPLAAPANNPMQAPLALAPNAPQALAPNAPQALAPYAVPGRVPCGCGCGCNYGCNCGCGCVVCATPVPPPARTNGGTLQYGGSNVSAQMRNTAGCGCKGTSQSYHKDVCGCGHNPCTCGEKNPTGSLKPRVVPQPTKTSWNGLNLGPPVVIKPHTPLTSDGVVTTKVDSCLNIVPPSHAITPPTGKGDLTQSVLCGTVPGLDYFPTYGYGIAVESGIGSSFLLTNVQVVIIFWGDYWRDPSLNTSAKDTSPSYIIEFFETILSSSLIDMLAEYSVGSLNIGHGTLMDNVFVPSSWGNWNLGGSVTQGDIRGFIYDLVTSVIAWYGPNTLYMVYVPKGVTVTKDDGSKSSVDFLGYHDDGGLNSWLYLGEPTIAQWAIGVICPDSYDNDTITINTSHELCEAITHPYQPNWCATGWNGPYTGPSNDHHVTDPSCIEIGDACYNFENCGCATPPRIGKFAVQPIWSKRQAACAINSWPWAAFPYSVKNSPAIASSGQNMVLAWTEDDGAYGPIRISNNTLNEGLDFSKPALLRAFGDSNLQFSIDRPAICFGFYLNQTFIAWTAGNDTQQRLNIISTGGDISNLSGDIWGDRFTFNEGSNSGPSLASAPLFSSAGVFGVVFLAYIDLNQEIHLRWSTDGGWSESNKVELQQWSPDGPSICYADPYLYLAFRGTTGDRIFVCRTSDFGKTLEVSTIPGQTTDSSPGITVVGNKLIVTWRGTDSNHRINAMSADLSSSNPLGSFENQVIYGDLANGGVSILTNPVDGSPYITWAGTNSGHSLNIMPLPPHIDSCFS